MNFNNNNTNRLNKINSRMYAESKEAMAIANRKLNTGKKVKQEHLVAWHKNKNNSKEVVNVVTGEVLSNARMLWLRNYTYISYSCFMLYIKYPSRSKGSVKNRKLVDLSIKDWRYENTN